jgi:cytochrome c
MDSYEFNKFAGAFLATLLVVLVVAMLSETLFEPEELEHNAYGVIESVAAAAADDPEPEQTLSLAALLNTGEAAGGARSARKCMSCHTLQSGEAHKIGPNLWGILGSPQGKQDGYKYSSSFKALEGDWGYAELDAFLENPKSAVSGTKMGFAGIKNPADRANLILMLRANSDSLLPLPQE